MMNSYMPPAKSDTHITPLRVFDIIEDTWHITKDDMFDPCPVDGKDGLIISWKHLNYVNPPYSNGLLAKFVYKAIDESLLGNRTVMLLPCKTDQAWFHTLIDTAGVEIRWIKGRLKFPNNQWSATQPHFLTLIQESQESVNFW